MQQRAVSRRTSIMGAAVGLRNPPGLRFSFSGKARPCLFLPRLALHHARRTLPCTPAWPYLHCTHFVNPAPAPHAMQKVHVTSPSLHDPCLPSPMQTPSFPLPTPPPMRRIRLLRAVRPCPGGHRLLLRPDVPEGRRRGGRHGRADRGAGPGRRGALHEGGLRRGRGARSGGREGGQGDELCTLEGRDGDGGSCVGWKFCDKFSLALHSKADSCCPRYHAFPSMSLAHPTTLIQLLVHTPLPPHPPTVGGS